MKASNNVGIICVIFVLVITLANASQSFAQTSTTPKITISTDTQSYVLGDVIVISGTISPLGTSDIVNIRILNPNELIGIDSVDVKADGTFSTKVIAYGPLWKIAGTYLVHASYSVKAGIVITAKTSFNYSPEPRPKGGFNGAGMGQMINCEKFPFEISFSQRSSDTYIPVVIEIIDPDGKLVGRDKFDYGGYHSSTRIIDVNWGKDGTYVIQTNEGGVIFHHNFDYTKRTPESFQNSRMACLKEKYVEPVLGKIYYTHSIYDPNNEVFWKSVQTVEELLSYYDPEGFANQYQDYVSQKTLKSIQTGEKKITNSSEIVPVLKELRVKLPDLIEKKIISVFQDGEKSIANSPNMTLNEKTDLIFYLRNERNPAITSQRNSVSSFLDAVHSIYTNAEARQQYLEHLKEMDKSAAQKKLAEATEKESIKQELLAQNKNVSKIPTWVKNNAKWWHDNAIGDDDFEKGLQYLIQQKIIKIADTKPSSDISKQIPSWIKNNAGWWANGQISDDEFVKGIQWLVSNGIIKT